eukprot:TRINITY_DN9465_c0_g1_i1.p1 TRINITY_DN9465_c0_g1~~TRINITY_DN9465_c0_g1_i1.p1  ORF type:complete len:108 (+),score=38.20 TRINITY_DN9465_c0_g1_i1:141-464(+)
MQNPTATTTNSLAYRRVFVKSLDSTLATPTADSEDRTLNDSKNEPMRVRKDRKGRAIGKGLKKYSVTFADSVKGVNEKLVVKHEVESYKEYNVLEVKKKEECGCLVF